ncbi:MAG TPA: hypothetical protein VLW50_13990 [Streptosporangiaceae bacterium]|nr:hypothetical protein [Streptosporangiaceae bacterium]
MPADNVWLAQRQAEHDALTRVLAAMQAAPGRAVQPTGPVGAENLCHQAIFMNHAPGAVTLLDPEMVQVGDAVGYRAERRGLFQVRCGRWVL